MKEKSLEFREILKHNYIETDDLMTNVRKLFRAILSQMYELPWEDVNELLHSLSRESLDKNPYFIEVEKYFQKAIEKGEIKNFNSVTMTRTLLISFAGLIYFARANAQVDYFDARELLDEQINMIFYGIRMDAEEDIFWEMLSEKGVSVNEALARLKNDKVMYKKFLIEFFEDPDFESLNACIQGHHVEDAFDYAHGLKGMAANLGLDHIYEALSVLVEILRRKSFDGALQAYEGIMVECRKIKSLLENQKITK